MRSLLSLLLIVGLPSLCVAAELATDDVVIADFEGPDYGQWTVEGDAFGSRPARGTLSGQQDVMGFRGGGFVNSFRNGDRSQGLLTSPTFTVESKYLTFLIGGGDHPGQTGVELLTGDNVVRSATGNNQEALSWHSWDVAEYRGKHVQLRIFDRSSGDFGHVNADHFVATNLPRSGPGVMRLTDYRRTPEYYAERYRPQFHFTPPMNWMNDPNGLVYFQGEYHLFYQHNPHGNSWGHMSWGHAVSDDLVHWKHLPIALHEEYGVMIFSGCCVVDWNNTSGFGRAGEPPLVAIYTGHGLGKQTQDIAYSIDRGRTWTKYAGNPVIDNDEADFRDPKVFWHEPSKKWVMVVAMAAAKYVQFYGSQDLKSWHHLSDFGPAGVQDKPNWECPDLFELPVEGDAGSSRWVLEVDMGSGAIAGGSGGEYFVGKFDGTHFSCDHDAGESQWVDYGRDFYAPVSYADIPESDGRRIWIGWMNNWQTCLVPTSPWRSAMSIPRTLSLRRINDRIQLVQQPVREMKRLRQDAVKLGELAVEGEVSLTERGIVGDRLEIVATLEVGDANEVGFYVRQGDGERTVVGYDAVKKQLFVDRTQSGDSSFHPEFAGQHAGPLSPRDGTIELQIFIDTSSVEVFGAAGAVVLTERIFPDPASVGVTLYAQGGTSKVKRMEAWKLKSVW